MLEIHLYKLGVVEGVQLNKVAMLLNIADNTFRAVTHPPVKYIGKPDFYFESYSDDQIYDILSSQYKSLPPKEKSVDGEIIKVGVISDPIQDNFYVRSIGLDCIVLTLLQTEDICRKAGRTKEEYLAISMLPHILWLKYKSLTSASDYLDLFHVEARGCILDFTGFKPDKVHKLRVAHIDSICKSRLIEAKIPLDLIESAESVLDYIIGQSKSKKTESLPHSPSKSVRPQRKLKIFLCHANEDKPAVRTLYNNLVDSGFEPWLDEECLIPGQKWKVEIPGAVKSSDVVIVCLSKKAAKKPGYIQKEIQYALDVADEQPEGEIFIIPLRLEECDVPERLSDWYWVNLFQEQGYERLIRALQLRGESLGLVDMA